MRDVPPQENSLTSGSENGNLQSSKRPQTLALEDIYIGRGLGAARKSHDIMDLKMGKHFDLVDGTHLEKVRVFAGKGVETPYDKAWRCVQKYKKRDPPIDTIEEDWQHVKVFGHVDYYGESRYAEIHWSQCDVVGMDDMFIKRWLE